MFKEEPTFNDKLNAPAEIFTGDEELLFENIRKMKGGKINERNFIDVFGEKEVGKNTEYANRKNNGNSKELPTQRGLMLEWILVYKLNELISRNCLASKTSDFDDLVNHTDIITEWKDSNGLMMAIDATIVGDKEGLEKKIDTIISELRDGKGATVKYFQSKLDGSKKEVSDIPKVIIAFDHENFKKLCHALLNPNENKSDLEFLQFHLLEDLIDQLITQEEILEREDSKLTDIYINIQELIKYLTSLYNKKEIFSKKPTEGIHVTPVSEEHRLWATVA